MTLFGWDASDFDWGRGPMDLVATKNDGITFLTHKATEGTSVIHAHYGTVLGRARAAGVEFLGAYGVPRTPGNGGAGTITAQVAYFMAHVNSATPWWRDVPGFFFQCDLEHWSNSKGVYDAVAPSYGVQWCDLVRQATGRTVVLYAPAWAYGNSIGGADPLWASNYGTNPAGHYREAYPGDASTRWGAYSGRTPAFLQYGSNLTIGTQPGCDANAYRGTLDQLRTLLTGGTPMPTPYELAAEAANEYGWARAQMADTALVVNPANGKVGPVPLGDVKALKQILAQAQTNGTGISALATAIAALGPAAQVDPAAVAAVLTADAGFADALAERVAAKLAARLQS
jgi:hypothetical protein